MRPQNDPRSAARSADAFPEYDLSDVPSPELVQWLLATADALSALIAQNSPDSAPPQADTRQAILRMQASLLRELRSRPVGYRTEVPTPRRAPSAAWPPPPW